MFGYSYTKNDFGEEMYCEIIVRGGTMFESHPHERKCKHIFDIYLQKEYSADKLSPHEPRSHWLPSSCHLST